MKLALLSVFVSVAVAGFATPIQAQLAVYDGFNYSPTGSAVTGDSGGGDSGWSGPWGGTMSSEFTIGSGSLSSPYLLFPTSGNMLSTTASDADKVAERTLATPLGTPGTTEYFSFLLQPTGTVGQGHDGGFFGLHLLGTVNDLYVGKPGASAATPNLYDIENSGGSDRVFTSVAAVSGQTEFMVLEANFTSGNDTFSLFINPGSTQPATANAVNSEINVGMITEIGVGGPGAFNFDELRIGSTYASVVPEPSSFALLAIAAATICAAACCRTFLVRGL